MVTNELPNQFSKNGGYLVACRQGTIITRATLWYSIKQLYDIDQPQAFQYIHAISVKFT